MRGAQEAQLVHPRPFAPTLPPSLPPMSSASPVPRRFANRTTDMAPMLCHAEPWPSLALPPVPSSLGVRSGREVAPRVLRREGCRNGLDPRHAPLRVLVLLRKRLAALRSPFSGCCSNSGAPSRGGASNASSSFLTLAVPWGATRPNSATAKRSSLSHEQAARMPRLLFLGLHGDESHCRCGFAPRRSRLTNGLTRRQHSRPSFSRPCNASCRRPPRYASAVASGSPTPSGGRASGETQRSRPAP